MRAWGAALTGVTPRRGPGVGASVAEVGGLDSWQRSTLAVAFAAGSPGRCDEAADQVVRMLDARFPQGVRVDRCMASWDDLEAIG